MVNRDNTVNIQGRIMVIVPFLPLTDIYLLTKFHFNPFCTFQDMARTGNNYEKLLRGDYTVNIQGMIIVLVHSTSPHCHHRISILVHCPFPHCHLSIYQG